MRFLIDEMFPQAVCGLLVGRGHDAVHVRDRGLNARPDSEVAAAATREGRALVTENVKDFAAERDLVVVCVLKADSRRGAWRGGWPSCSTAGRARIRSPTSACTGLRDRRSGTRGSSMLVRCGVEQVV